MTQKLWKNKQTCFLRIEFGYGFSSHWRMARFVYRSKTSATLKSVVMVLLDGISMLMVFAFFAFLRLIMNMMGNTSPD